MKKNIVFGMLVSLLAIPTYTYAQAATDANASDGAASAEKAEKTDYSHYTAGSTISLGFGLAGSNFVLGANSVNAYSQVGFPSFNASLRYTYYVYKFMGITTGLDFTQYNATVGLKDRMAWGAKTDMDEPYERFMKFGEGGNSTWTEVEKVNMLEVPIALTFKYKPNKVGLIGSLGMKLAFPVSGTYQGKGNLNLDNYFYLRDFTETEKHVSHNILMPEGAAKYDRNVWSTVNGSVFAEFGALFQLHQRLDLSVSVYASYGVNNILATSNDFGFNTKYNKLDEANAPMPEYKGILGTSVVDKVNPWCVGGKIALHINCRKKSDEQIAAEAYVAPEVVYVYDTVHQVVNQVIHDTIVVEVCKIDTTNSWILEKNTYIFYRVGDAVRPIIEPANRLDIIASALVANRTARVVIAGYASSEGNPSYNQRLSQKRAETIAQMLRQRGVLESQIEIQAYGAAKNANTTNKDEFPKDRRVDIMPIK